MAHCNLIKCCCVAVCPSHFWTALVMPLVNNVLLAMLSICTCRCFSTCPWLMTQKKTMVPSPTEQLIFACKPTHCKPYILAAVWRAGCQSIGICFKKWRRNNKNGFKKNQDSIPTRTFLCQLSWNFHGSSGTEVHRTHRSAFDGPSEAPKFNPPVQLSQANLKKKQQIYNKGVFPKIVQVEVLRTLIFQTTFFFP